MKIGYTRALTQRMSALRLEPLAIIEPDDLDIRSFERQAHRALSQFNVHSPTAGRSGGEWFQRKPEAVRLLQELLGVPEGTFDYIVPKEWMEVADPRGTDRLPQSMKRSRT